MREKIKQLFDTKTTRGKILRFCLFLVVLALVLLLLYGILKWTGLWEKVNSIEKIRNIVESGGVYSFLIFILFQILQTTVLQIPAIFVTVAGAHIFGAWPTFVMSYIAMMIGSIIMFWIGRKAGRKFLYWLIGKDSAEKWIDRMSNGKYLFFLMMIFPMFPDDILCVVAGLTKMSFPFFLWTNIIARGLGIACTVFFGSGEVIPFHGWGLAVWAVILVLVAIAFYISIRYKNKIDEIIDQIFYKRKKAKQQSVAVMENGDSSIVSDSENIKTDAVKESDQNMDKSVDTGNAIEKIDKKDMSNTGQS